MRLYFAAGEVEKLVKICLAAGGKNMLGSFPKIVGRANYLSKAPISGCNSFFLDSGAFSAFTLGTPIDVQQYGAYLVQNKRWLGIYANLDVIGDWRATHKNQLYLEQLGLTPLPVFHLASPAEPWEHLKDLVQRYDYLAIGGVATTQFTVKEKAAFLDKCWSIVGAEWKRGRQVKIHGFGVTSNWAVKNYPWFSVDSAAWSIAGGCGVMYKFTGTGLVSCHYTDTDAADFKRRNALAGSGTTRYIIRSQINVVEMLKFADFVTTVWKHRGVTWDA